MDYKFFTIEKQNSIATVFLNKPETRNAMGWDFWIEMPKLCEELSADKEIKVIVIRGKGKSFSLGLDLREFIKIFEDKNLLSTPTAEQRMDIRDMILTMQKAINAVAALEKPVIAAVQKHCIGAGLDLISACDIRLCSKDAVFSLRETKVAIVADMGSLQRLPAIIGQGNTRRMAFTGEDIKADKAKKMGLVDEIYENEESLIEESYKLAAQIAKNSSLVLKGVKAVLNSHSEQQISAALDYVCTWNSAFLDSQEFFDTMQSFKNRFKL